MVAFRVNVGIGGCSVEKGHYFFLFAFYPPRPVYGEVFHCVCFVENHCYVVDIFKLDSNSTPWVFRCVSEMQEIRQSFHF